MRTKRVKTTLTFTLPMLLQQPKILIRSRTCQEALYTLKFTGFIEGSFKGLVHNSCVLHILPSSAKISSGFFSYLSGLCNQQTGAIMQSWLVNWKQSCPYWLNLVRAPANTLTETGVCCVLCLCGSFFCLIMMFM